MAGTKTVPSAICEAAEPLVGKLPSRQSLNAHGAIVTAYQTKKEALKGRGPKIRVQLV